MDDFDARRASLDLVTAFVNNNKLSAAELPTLLSDVFKAISGFEIQGENHAKSDEKPIETTLKSKPSAPAETKASITPAAPRKIKSPSPDKTTKAPRANKPAVSVEESLSDPDFIVSLITGEKFKTLKRHLRKHGLTEAEYRARFNLPDDYPFVAPAYSQVRRSVAHKRHDSDKNARQASEPVEIPASQAKAKAPQSAKAKPAPKNKTRETKKTSALRDGRAKQSGARKSRANVAAADAALKKSGQPVPSPNDAAVSATSTPQAAPDKISEAANKVPVKKPASKRRMARQPAAGVTSSDAAVTLASVQEHKLDEASPDTSKQSATMNSTTKSTTPTSREGAANAKPARKGRKKLSPSFG